MAYVLNINGQPLMPTDRHGKVRKLLKDKKAKVVNRCPFTIILLYEVDNITQPIALGVDSGSKHIGLSATTSEKILFEADVTLRNDIVENLSTRRESRRTRRYRKTRYRKPKFNNRKRSDKWLAPSVQNKINTHLSMVEKVHKILPISKIIVEVASFDTQLLKAKEYGLEPPEGEDYQKGETLNFFNTREYVLFRDNHTCQCCKGKSKDKILNVHHIESRKTGGNAPNNLVTLCETCHNKYHKGEIDLPKSIKKGVSFKDATFMGIMRWAFYNKLKENYKNVNLTYGYITKNTRIENKLPKEHFIDARCISGNPNTKSSGAVFYYKKVRCHNRQIHKFKINKGGTRKLNQAPYVVKGFRLFDKVTCQNKLWYINGRRLKGSFVLKNLKGETLEIASSKIKLVNHQQSYLIEVQTII